MSAADRCFVDSNIWLYAFVAGQDAAKTSVAARLLQRDQIAVSVQVINEVCVNLIKKADFAEPEVRALIEAFFAKYIVTPLDRQVLLDSSALRARYSFSYWDSTIVAGALYCGATTLYSEDLQHNLLVDGSLRIINPFALQ